MYLEIRVENGRMRYKCGGTRDDFDPGSSALVHTAVTCPVVFM